jgi:vacuolar protein sorting-associated protein IST1
MHKYGRDFSAAVMENRSGCVSERVSMSPAGILNSVLPLPLQRQVMRKLVIETPSDQLVDAYLGEIAKAYGVNWAPASLTAATAEVSFVVH